MSSIVWQEKHQENHNCPKKQSFSWLDLIQKLLFLTKCRVRSHPSSHTHTHPKMQKREMENRDLKVIAWSVTLLLKSAIVININWWDSRGFPGGDSGKQPSCQCRRHKKCRFNPWFRNIPWRRAWQSAPIFLPGESHGKSSPMSGLQSIGLQRVSHDWSDLAHTHV